MGLCSGVYFTQWTLIVARRVVYLCAGHYHGCTVEGGIIEGRGGFRCPGHT